MMPTQKERAAAMKQRIARADGLARCSVFGCARPTMAAERVGLSALHCRYHVQKAARHGSPWAPTLKAGDLKPYLKAVRTWLRKHRDDPAVKRAISGLDLMLWASGRPEPADNIRRKPAADRARVALARLRAAEVPPQRLLAIHMGVTALIEDHRDAHKRNTEYRIVQVAKAAHRLASGTHRRWDAFPRADGTLAIIEMHTYPKSSGMVLRVIGAKIERECEEVTFAAVEEVRAIRRAQSGLRAAELAPATAA